MAGSLYRPKDTDSTSGTRPTEQFMPLKKGAGTSGDGSMFTEVRKRKEIPYQKYSNAAPGTFSKCQ